MTFLYQLQPSPTQQLKKIPAHQHGPNPLLRLISSQKHSLSMEWINISPRLRGQPQTTSTHSPNPGHLRPYPPSQTGSHLYRVCIDGQVCHISRCIFYSLSVLFPLCMCMCQKHATGQELFMKVCDHLNLLEKDYYGLSIWETPTMKVNWTLTVTSQYQSNIPNPSIPIKRRKRHLFIHYV